MIRLIPPEDRNKHRCCLCGSTPVKYVIPTHDPLSGDGLHDLTYCNKCAFRRKGREMNDTEIKKALECHTKEDGVCDGCPLYPDNACVHILTKSALDLINLQQAEIAKLEKYIYRCKSGEEYWVKCLLERPNEAVREFAGLFKARLRDVARGKIGGCTYYMIGESFVDKIVKEMVGDTE